METTFLLLYSQASATLPCPEPDKSNSHSTPFFPTHNLISHLLGFLKLTQVVLIFLTVFSHINYG